MMRCGVRAVTDVPSKLTENLTSGSPHMVILTDLEYNNRVCTLMLMKEIVAKSSKSMGMSGARGIDLIVIVSLHVLGS